MNKNAIIINDLSMRFGDIQALNKIKFNIPSGTIFGLLGSNGAGKTTLIRILLGLLIPTQGSGSILGYDLLNESNKIRNKTGVLLDHTGLYKYLTVYENLDFYARIWNIPKQMRKKRIYELAELFNFSDKIKANTQTLSKGTLQKVAIARSIISEPELLILDEPTTGLDPISVIQLRKLLLELVKNKNTTVFLNTHNLGEAEILCDRIGIINKGEIIKVEETKKLFENEHMHGINLLVSRLPIDFAESLELRYKIEIKFNENNESEIFIKDNSIVENILEEIHIKNITVKNILKKDISLEDIFIKYINKKQNDK